MGSWFQEGVGAAKKSRQLYQACAGSWSQEDLGCSGFLQPRSRSSRSNDVTKATWGHRGACGAGIEPPMRLKTGKTARISALPSPLNFKKVNSPSESDGEITQLKLCRAPANHENGGYGHGAGYCDGGNGGHGGPRRQRRRGLRRPWRALGGGNGDDGKAAARQRRAWRRPGGGNAGDGNQTNEGDAPTPAQYFCNVAAWSNRKNPPRPPESTDSELDTDSFSRSR